MSYKEYFSRVRDTVMLHVLDRFGERCSMNVGTFRYAKTYDG